MIELDVKGVDEINDLLESIAPRHAMNIARNTVHGVAGEVAEDVREWAPFDQGTLEDSVAVKRRKQQRGIVQSDVVMGRDGFYWRMHEYGTAKMSARPFVLPALRGIEGRLPSILREQFIKKFQNALRRQRKRMGG